MADPAPAHAAVILAAGASRRFGRSKQLFVLDGQTLVRRAAELALATQPACSIVVVGAEADAVHAALYGLPVRRVDCCDWQRGMGASLQAGLAALPPQIDGALVVLCDQPALDAAHLLRLVARWQSQPACAAASAYGGQLGAPALLPRAWFGALGDDADAGARELLRRRGADVCAIVNDALAQDVDVAGDLPPVPARNATEDR